MRKIRRGWESKEAIERYENSFSGDAMHNIEPEILKYICCPGKEQPYWDTVLDVAAGSLARHTNFLMRVSRKVVAVDISREVVRRLRKRMKDAPNVEIVRCDMKHMPFESNTFQLVLSIDAIAHGKMVSIKKYVDELKRVVKPGGKIILVTLSRQHPNYKIVRERGKKLEEGTFVGGLNGEWGTVHHYFTKKELENLFKNFNIIELKLFKRRFGYNAGGIHWFLVAEKPSN